MALAVESHARHMEAQGYGAFSIRNDAGGVITVFGPVKVRGENCDVALLRLASALLDQPEFCEPFLTRIRNLSMNLPVIHRRDNQLTVRTTADRP